MKKIYYIAALAIVSLVFACNPVAKLDRSKVPAAGPAPVIRIGDYQLFTLDNGLKVIVVENHKLPRVSYNINLDRNPIKEGNKAGYVELAGSLMSAGTTTRSKAQIDEKVDFLGASLSTSSTSVSGSCLKKHSDELLAVMSDVLLNPSFPQDEFDKAIKQTLSGLTSEKTSPDAISEKVGNLMKYGKDHPYGEIMTESTVNKIERNDVVNYYNSYFKPNESYLVIVGDITFEDAKTQANKYFGTWKSGKISELTFPTPTVPAANRVVFVPLPGAVQSVIDITYPIDVKPGTQEAIVASMLNNVLGGSGFQARLMQNLREDKAYTYGAYSSISPDEFVGSFSAGASVRNAVTDSSIVQFLYEMDKLVNEPIPDTTIQIVKNIMTGSFARSLEGPQTIARFALNIEKYKLPKDYYETYLQKLNSITAADLQTLAKKVIKPSNAFITVVGNKEIVPTLEKFAANGKVELYNPDGTVYTDLRPAPDGMTAKDVLKKYVDAIGGEAALSKVKSMEQKGTMNLGPMSAQVNVKVKDNSKFKMVINIGGMEMVKQVYNGTKGVMVQMAKSEPLGESDVADLKSEMDMLSEMNYEKNGIVPTLKGIDKLDNGDAYVVELKKPDGSITTEFYNVATGLKSKILGVEGEGEDMVNSETIINDYATKDGIKYVSKRTQNVGPQTIIFSIDELIINPKIDDKEFSID